jgi:integrase
MASVRKKGKIWYYRFTDADGVQRELPGCTDKRETEGMLADARAEAAKIRNGHVDRKASAYRANELKPLPEHIDAWQANLVAEGSAPKHAEHASNRVRRLVAMMLGANEALNDHRRLLPKDRGEVARKIADAIAQARLSSLTRDKVQDTIARFKSAGWSLQTCNHYRAAAKAFSKWCYDTDRTRDDVLHGVKGFNVKEDRRHDRRTVSLDELRTLIQAASNGTPFREMTGPMRALCYRLAVASGLRYSEIATIVPESFDSKARTVTVHAAYTKNGDPATFPLPDELDADLAAYVSALPAGEPIFPLPDGLGAKMLRHDLSAAGIPYVDASGLYFDFHSLRCQTATLADQAGVSPRVVQKIMRHSSLELTGRYTRPRAVDIEAAASMLPSLKPMGYEPEALAATGTEGGLISRDFSLLLPYSGDAEGRSRTVTGEMSHLDGPTGEMRLSLKKEAQDAPGRVQTGRGVEEAPPGFEPGMKVLQTSALPLGYGARKR